MTTITSCPSTSCKNTASTCTEIIRPWNRFRTNCPSSEFDKLNMRRKAEVLKYTNNKHKLTKKQRYSLAAKNLLTKRKSWANQKLGEPSNPNISTLTKVGNTLTCLDQGNSTKPLEFLSTSSDVPGKPIMLKLDPTVPLTMYTPVRRTYMAGSTKWPQFGWYSGARGFPVGKKGMLFS